MLNREARFLKTVIARSKKNGDLGALPKILFCTLWYFFNCSRVFKRLISYVQLYLRAVISEAVAVR